MSRGSDSQAGRGVARELLEFLWERKLWWLLPMALVLLAFGAILITAQGSTMEPFVYSLF